MFETIIGTDFEVIALAESLRPLLAAGSWITAVGGWIVAFGVVVRHKDAGDVGDAPRAKAWIGEWAKRPVDAARLWSPVYTEEVTRVGGRRFDAVLLAFFEDRFPGCIFEIDASLAASRAAREPDARVIHGGLVVGFLRRMSEPGEVVS